MLTAREMKAATSPPAVEEPADVLRDLAPRIAGPAVLLLVLLTALSTSRYVVDVVLGALVLLSLSGPVGTVAAITLAGVIRLLHPEVFTQGIESTILGWVILLAAGIRTLPSLRRIDAAALAWFWAFAGWAALTSLGSSALPLVSVLKASMLVWVVTTLFVACHGLTRAQRARVAGGYVALGLVVVGLSLATLLKPGIAYALGGTGLQGILWHPQTLAVVVAPLVALSATQCLLVGRRAAAMALLTGSAGVLVLTEARTGVIAALAGVVAAVLMTTVQSDPSRAAPRRLAAILALAIVPLVLLPILMSSTQITSTAREFLLKHSGESSLLEAFEQSRGAGIALQLQNFRERPLLGHGFGVNPSGPEATEVVRFWDIPVSAPTEKGFILSAALEETGIVGTVLLLAALFGLGRRAWRSADRRLFAVFVTCLVTNMGEATLFATGGVGLLLWSLIAFAATHPARDAHLQSQGALPDATRIDPLRGPVPRW